MKTTSLSVLFILLCVFIVPTLNGQAYLCKQEFISVEDGLSSRFVRSMVQDGEGFMWFATKYGLNRYDGKTFKVFTHKSHQLQHNFIDKVYEDEDDHLWVGYAVNTGSTESFKGVDLLNIHTFEVTPIEEYMGDALPFKVTELYKIYPDTTSKKLYLLTNSGALYLYEGNRQFKLCYQDANQARDKIRNFKLGKRFNWFSSGNHIAVLDPNFKVIQQQEIQDEDIYSIHFIGEATDSTVWFHSTAWKTGRKVYTWKVHQAVEERETFSFFQENRALEDDAQFTTERTWKGYFYSSKYGVCLLDSTKQVFYKAPDHLSFIRTYYIDKQRNIWIAFSGNGICKITCQENKFTPYFKGASTRDMTIVGDSMLIVNSYSGRLHHHLKTRKDSVQRFFFAIDVDESSDQKHFWISQEAMQLERFSWDSLDTPQRYFYKKSALEKKHQLSNEGMNLGWAVFEAQDGRIWIGTSGGIGYKEQGADSLDIFFEFNGHEELSSAIINHFYEDELGIWVAASTGLYLIDRKKGVLRRYAQEKEAPFRLPNDHILHIHKNEKDIYWLSTRGGGLIQLNIERGTYEQFTTKQGLSHNVVYSILEDDYGYFWMGSDYGLMRFNPETSIVNTYLPRDGILHEEFNHKSFHKAQNGQLYFGGMGGAISVNPSDFVTQEAYKIPLQLVRFQYFDGAQSALLDRTTEVLASKEIVLDYTDRFFVVDFAFLDFKAGEESRYAYQIEGLDQEWHFIESNSVRINGLDAGNYTLRVKGQGSNGIWSDHELELPILVKQPFYMRWEFFLAMSFIAIVLIALYARWRVANLRKAKETLEEEVKKRTQKIEQQANELKELDNVKSRFFANISHELRTPLTLMLGPVSAILEQHYGNDLNKINSVLEIVQRNGGKLQELIEEILVLSKLEAQNVALEEKTLFFLPLLRRLFLAFEAQAHLQQIELNLNYELDEKLYVLLDENKFEKILNNLLSNALKYTPRGGMIELNINSQAIQDNLLQLDLAVVDSGKGIHPQDLPYIFDRFYQSKHKEAIVQGGTGIGLALAYEFAQLLGGNLRATSKLGEGSTFLLNMPIKVAATPAVVEVETEVLPDIVQQMEESAQTTKDITILVVEDNDDMRAFIADLLGTYYNILTAENGRIGLEVLTLNGEQVDLIVSDVMMPEMDGFQLLQQVKAHKKWQQLPMVMLTARATEQDKLFALRIGVDDYLPKPFSRQELLVRIHNLLQNYQQRKHWQLEAVEEEIATSSEKVEESLDAWMEEVENIVRKEVGNTQFGITNLAFDLNISERQLRRKIKTKTGLTPHQYFRLMKLDMARHFLEKRRYETVSEVAYKVGFSNVHYFSKLYQAQYGKKPLDYLKN